MKQNKLYIVFLGLIAAIPALSTDMYLAAIPRIAEQWHVDKSIIDRSLILWFVAYSATLLIWGSLSDRYGRKPILLSGLIGFIVSTFLCAISQNPYHLIFARILQGISAAGASSMVMAIARDQFEGKDRQKVLAWIGMIIGITPMVAPSIGALILKYINWRFIFAAQAILCAVSLTLTLSIYSETAAVLDKGGLSTIVKRYVRLAKNVNYMLANCTTGLLSASFLGYIAFSATAYIVHFGLTEQQFGILFGANALCSIIGSAACVKLIKKHDEFKLIIYTFIGVLVGGIIILTTGSLHWLIFAIGMGIISFSFGVSRPLVNHLILEQVTQDIGAASSGIVCYQFIAGAVGMAISTQPWERPFIAYGILAVSCPLIVLAVWPILTKRIKHAEHIQAGNEND